MGIRKWPGTSRKIVSPPVIMLSGTDDAQPGGAGAGGGGLGDILPE